MAAPLRVPHSSALHSTISSGIECSRPRRIPSRIPWPPRCSIPRRRCYCTMKPTLNPFLQVMMWRRFLWICETSSALLHFVLNKTNVLLDCWPKTTLGFLAAMGIARLWGVIPFLRHCHSSLCPFLAFCVVTPFYIYLSARLNEYTRSLVGGSVVWGVHVPLSITLIPLRPPLLLPFPTLSVPQKAPNHHIRLAFESCITPQDGLTEVLLCSTHKDAVQTDCLCCFSGWARQAYNVRLRVYKRHTQAVHLKRRGMQSFRLKTVF